MTLPFSMSGWGQLYIISVGGTALASPYILVGLGKAISYGTNFMRIIFRTVFSERNLLFSVVAKTFPFEYYLSIACLSSLSIVVCLVSQANEVDNNVKLICPVDRGSSWYI